MNSVSIRAATRNEVPLILNFIRELAIYEDHLNYFTATEERLQRWLFGSKPKAFALLAFHEEEPVGFALYYYTFSTFASLPGLYLEDLFVKPEIRRFGIGRALLQEIARIAKAEGCFRIEWAVLHWNESAINFYKKLGAVTMADWSVYRLWGDALDSLAAEPSFS